MVRESAQAVQPMSGKRKRDNGAAYSGPDRRQDDNLKRAEFGEFVGEIRNRLGNQDATLAKFDTALFSKDSDNEHGTPGVMVILQKVNGHIDVMCAWAKTGKKILKFAFWIITGAGGAVAAAKAAGWL